MVTVIRISRHDHTGGNAVRLDSFYMNAARVTNNPTRAAEVGLLQSGNVTAMHRLSESVELSKEAISALERTGDAYARGRVLSRPGVPVEKLREAILVSGADGQIIREAIARSPYTPVEILELLVEQDDGTTIGHAISSEHLPEWLLCKALVRFYSIDPGLWNGHEFASLVRERPAIHDAIALTAQNVFGISAAVSENLSTSAVVRLVNVAVLPHGRDCAGSAEDVGERAQQALGLAVALFDLEVTPDAVRPALAAAAYCIEKRLVDATLKCPLRSDQYWGVFARMGERLPEGSDRTLYEALIQERERVSAAKSSSDWEELKRLGEWWIRTAGEKSPLGPRQTRLNSREQILTNLVMNPYLRYEDFVSVVANSDRIVGWNTYEVLANRYPAPVTSVQAEEIAAVLSMRQFSLSFPPTHGAESDYQQRTDWHTILSTAIRQVNHDWRNEQPGRIDRIIGLVGDIPEALIDEMPFWYLISTERHATRVFAYLAQAFGTDARQWDTFNILAETHTGTLGEIIVGVKELV